MHGPVNARVSETSTPTLAGVLSPRSAPTDSKRRRCHSRPNLRCVLSVARAFPAAAVVSAQPEPRPVAPDAGRAPPVSQAVLR